MQSFLFREIPSCSLLFFLEWLPFGGIRYFRDGLSVLIRMAKVLELCELKEWQSRAGILKPKLKPTEAQPEKDAAFFLSAPEISVFVPRALTNWQAGRSS